MSEKRKTPKKLAVMKELLEDPQVQSWRAIMGAFQSVLADLEKGLMSDGLHVSRFQIFFYLYFEAPLSAADIARKLLVTRGNISTFLKRLEKDKQIVVCPTSPSMQRPLYRLSEVAERQFEKIFPDHIKRVKKLVPVLPKSVTQSLLTLGQITPER
ncbi:MAG: helix-turn-helix domain-containing protein [Pseudomonadota bacterium]|nr:helix-turn-helix domain-containing protein [Pseudomonadota bacterium]